MNGLDLNHLRNLSVSANNLRKNTADTSSNEIFVRSIRQMSEKELSDFREAIDAVSLVSPHVIEVLKRMKSHHELEMSCN